MDLTGIDLERVPLHVACVMDGNGRWAQQRGLKRTDGHSAGEEALIDSVRGAIGVGVKWLSVYAFSTENWRRPTEEVRFLMGFNESILVRRRDELNDMGVRIRFAGRRDWRVPKRLIRQMDECIELTKSNSVITLTICFNYGGRAEIVDAAAALVAAGQPITEKGIADHLYDSEMPDVDLWIRTSGESRISNFLIWQAAYAELIFTERFWPDMRAQHIADAALEFQQRDHRFGGLSS